RLLSFVFFFSSRRRHTRCLSDWSSDVCSSDLAMRARGVRFGKALQMTNVLRDVPRDLGAGRCYLPARDLAALGLTPADLFDAERSEERRVGKECRSGRLAEHYTKKRNIACSGR